MLLELLILHLQIHSITSKMSNLIFILLFSIGCTSCSPSNDGNPPVETPHLYFPTNGTPYWASTSIESLNWNSEALAPLLDFLEEKNTKGFIVLHNGKIVVESYMNGHSQTSNWYWASAGKTLTSTVVGIAHDEGLINLSDPVSTYIGKKWTSASPEKELLINSKHLLTMTSGLDEKLGDEVSPQNLQYVADAGEKWVYHNVYVKMQDVVAQASDLTWDAYFNSRLKNAIGMNGVWTKLEDLNVFWSNTRSMARFGLMVLAKGKWQETQIVSESFLKEATTATQKHNLAYGYLWWLNGKISYVLPGIPFEFQGSLIPNAPDDLIAALGKNDQKLYVVPSKNLVIVRMGEVANSNTPTFGLSGFDNELWGYINALIN